MSKGAPVSGKPGGHKTPPKGYPTNRTQYADPANYKYPLDTEARIKAAWSYIHQEKNRKAYGASELTYMESRIKAAGKKYGIKFNKEGRSRAPGDVETCLLDPLVFLDLTISEDLKNLTF